MKTTLIPSGVQPAISDKEYIISLKDKPEKDREIKGVIKLCPPNPST